MSLLSTPAEKDNGKPSSVSFVPEPTLYPNIFDPTKFDEGYTPASFSIVLLLSYKLYNGA